MMKGYDKQEALEFILQRIHAKDHPELAECLHYEDDEAFEFMVEKLAADNKLEPVKAVKLASLVDDYMDYQQAYLESQGLMDWDDV